jgi:hypothetical protein
MTGETDPETEYQEIEPRYTAVAEAEAAALLRRWAPGVDNPESLAAYLVAVLTGPIAAGSYNEAIKITRAKEESHLDLARLMAVEEVRDDLTGRAGFVIREAERRGKQLGVWPAPQQTTRPA